MTLQAGLDLCTDSQEAPTPAGEHPALMLLALLHPKIIHLMPRSACYR